jgi:hypothetical protein
MTSFEFKGHALTLRNMSPEQTGERAMELWYLILPKSFRQKVSDGEMSLSEAFSAYTGVDAVSQDTNSKVDSLLTQRLITLIKFSEDRNLLYQFLLDTIDNFPVESFTVAHASKDAGTFAELLMSVLESFNTDVAEDAKPSRVDKSKGFALPSAKRPQSPTTVAPLNYRTTASEQVSEPEVISAEPATNTAIEEQLLDSLAGAQVEGKFSGFNKDLPSDVRDQIRSELPAIAAQPQITEAERQRLLADLKAQNQVTSSIRGARPEVTNNN